MTTRKQTTRINRSKRQNYIIVWVDGNIKTDDNDTKNTKTELQKVANEVQLITEPEKCIEILNEFNGTRSFVITSGAFGQTLVPQIHLIKNLEAIFVFCGNKKYHEGWSKEWKKIQLVETKIAPICQALGKLVSQVKNDEIAMSFIETDLKELEPSFMYTGLLKDTLLTMDFTSDHIEKMVRSFLQQYQDDPNEQLIINEFAKKYRAEKAIWWYTRESFVYNDVNRSLRDLDGDIIIDMGFFIHDLHKQIEQLYQQQLPSFGKEKFILYRGQGLSEQAFEKAKKSKGGLLGFNCFLSTSTNRSISIEFAERGSERSGCIGVLFVITIDPSLQLVPFARIKAESAIPAEDEILFAMHTIFKIGEVKPLPKNTNIFQVSLELTSEDDPRLQGLKKYMAGQYGDHGGHKLGRILFDMGQHDKAEEIYLELLETTSNERERGSWNHCLGLIKDNQGKYQEAIEYYEKAMEIQKRILPENDPSLAATYHCIGLVYDHMGEYSKALSNYEQSLEIKKKSLPEDHPDIAESYNNIGLVYVIRQEFSKALANCEKSIEIRKKSLPKDHPDIAESYHHFGVVYSDMREYSKALQYYEQSLEIKKKSLPKDHPSLATSYNNIGQVYNNMGDYSKALLNYEQSLEILKKSLPKDHPNIASSYMNIGCVYHSSKQYPKALEYLEEARRIYMISLPPAHPDIRTVNLNITIVKVTM